MPLPHNWALPEKIRERFGMKSTGRQRAMIEDGHLLLILHRAPAREASQREGTFFWRKPNGTWEYSGGGDGLVMLQRHIQAYSAAEERFRGEYERATSAEDYFRLLEALPSLRHAAKNQYMALQAAREAIHEDRALIDLRDWAYDIERNLDLLYEDVRNALEFSVARKAEEQARLSMQELQTAHRLNVLAAIFYPIMALAGVFGMNLSNGLEDSPVWLFWVVLLGGIGLGLYMRNWVLSGASRPPTAPPAPAKKQPDKPSRRKRWDD